MLAKFGCIPKLRVRKRAFVVSESLFERVFCQSNVRFLGLVVFAGHSGLVNHAFNLTSLFERAVSFLAAVTVGGSSCFVLAGLFVEDGFIMGGDYGFDVGHAAVAKFDGISVEYLV